VSCASFVVVSTTVSFCRRDAATRAPAPALTVVAASVVGRRHRQLTTDAQATIVDCPPLRHLPPVGHCTGVSATA